MSDDATRVSIVTGPGGALGGALARRLLDGGERVAMLDRRPERLADDFPELTSEPSRAAAFAVDLADGDAVERAVATAWERFGRVDAVFNLAGGWRGGATVAATSDADWQWLLDANFRSTLHVCRAAFPRLVAQDGGVIVNVGSRASLHGDAGSAAYSVAKTAVLRLTESLAAEGKRLGVRVNCVLPGTIDTPANRAAMPDADLSRWVPLDAMVDAVLLLASPAARAVHGAALPVFGTA
jgi:NAD(P)-dependent dehydrogenase (short-subunit alcohol dehydrogenase family)